MESRLTRLGRNLACPNLARPALAPCANGTVVPSPASNPGLVSDCEALLAANVVMGGTGNLNWSADRDINTWEDVIVAGTPLRVTHLYLSSKGLHGSIPAELGDLTKLRDLRLSSNSLAGSIPVEMGNLSNLQYFLLDNNGLTGEVPRNWAAWPTSKTWTSTATT